MEMDEEYSALVQRVKARSIDRAISGYATGDRNHRRKQNKTLIDLYHCAKESSVPDNLKGVLDQALRYG